MDIPKVAVFISLSILLTSCASNRQVTLPPSGGAEAHISFLASDDLQGRYPGTEGDMISARYIEKYFELTGLEAAQQEFDFVESVRRGPFNSFIYNGIAAKDEDYTPFDFSPNAIVEADLVFAGYGITVKTDSFEWDDYKGLDVKGKWIMVLRGYPEITGMQDLLKFASEDRDKAMLAADNGASGVIFVSDGQSDQLVTLKKRSAPVGIPCFHISRALADSILIMSGNSIGQIENVILSRQNIRFDTGISIKARSDIENVTGVTRNVYGILNGTHPELSKEYIVVGAHYDHLGFGGQGSSSRRQDTTGVHNGADDNASGVAVMLELASKIKRRQHELGRSFVFVAFGAEEMGLLGSKHFVNNMPMDPLKIVAMINLDMVGRFDTSKGLQIGGIGTSIEADSLVRLSNRDGIKLRLSNEGSGPSDHSSFYGKNIPVFFITTGAHLEYHTPEDDADRINYKGLSVVEKLTENLLISIANHPEKLTFTEAGPKETATRSDYRFKVTLGFMPDFSSTDIEGVRVDFVTKGKAAERGGLKSGDIIIAIDGLAVRNIYDYMYRLGKLSRNQIISVEILRNGIKEVLVIQL